MTPAEAAALIDGLGDAFAAGDLEAALGAFVPGEEAMYVGSEPAEHAVGRAALRELLDGLFARDERYLWRCESVVVAASANDVAVCAEARLYVLPVGSPRAAEPAESFPYRISGVLVAAPEGWRWRLCHGSEPAAA